MTALSDCDPEDRARIGKGGRRRLETALMTLIDAEGALKSTHVQRISEALSAVCDGLRELIGDEW